MTATALDLVEKLEKVASLPMIFTRINDAVNDPRSSATDIGRIIAEDSGLSARLLKLVNSAFFNFPSKIETISRSVTIVGTQQLRDLALATSVINLFQGMDGDLVSMESFWRHSIACGVSGRVLANHRREGNAERFFVGGMLHDIGRLVLYSKKPEEQRVALQRCHSGGELLYQAEREELGFDHADVGGALLARWKLPESLSEVVAYHHAPQRARRYPVEVALIHVADVMAHALELGTSGERYVPPLDAKAWKLLGLSPSIMASSLDLVERQYEDAIQMIL